MPSPQVMNILVVDDLLDNLFLLQTLLESEGYQVSTADAGQAALDQIRTAPPDLVLLDVMMPQLDGYEVTRQIRQVLQLPDLPILLITAHDEANAAQGLALGANEFVRKPINFDELLQRVQSLLHHDFPTADSSFSSRRA